MKKIQVIKLGQMSYSNALRVQERIWAKRENGSFKDTLLLVEHVPQVYSYGRRDSPTDMLMDESQLKKLGIEIHHVGRVLVTWHGPGQLVGYPILNLANYQKSVRWYFNTVQKAIQDTIGHFGIPSGIYCEPSLVGLWAGPEKTRKIAAMGVQLSKWHTMHGFALNVNVDMFGFNNIIPCGIADKKYSVTSMAKELNRDITIDEVMPIMIENFGKAFGTIMEEKSESKTNISGTGEERALGESRKREFFLTSSEDQSHSSIGFHLRWLDFLLHR